MATASTPPMRIGVNALYLIPGAVGGTEIYLDSLLRALAAIDARNQYLVFTNRETADSIAPARRNFRCLAQPIQAANRPLRIIWEQTGLPMSVARAEIDVLFNPGFTAPLLCPCPCVTVFHDLQHKRHPEYFRWFDRPAWRLCLFQAATTAHTLIAVSEATRIDLLRYYPVSPSSVRVIPHGVDEHLFEIGRQRRTLTTDPFLLCVSTLHPHKNLERLVAAFSRFRHRHPEYRLVIAGIRGFHAGAIERLVRALNLSDAVRITGWIPRADLYELYLRAHACVLPSTFEGFGLPLVEALAAAVPTACSRIDPFQEIAGGAALAFDPLEEDGLFHVIERIAFDEALRRELALAGPARATAFTWRACAEATLSALEAANRPRS